MRFPLHFLFERRRLGRDAPEATERRTNVTLTLTSIDAQLRIDPPSWSTSARCDFVPAGKIGDEHLDPNRISEPKEGPSPASTRE